MIGDLGPDEILLMSFDSNDVMAYFTKQIAKAVCSGAYDVDTLTPTPIIRPFFHENVAMSAWGLAVHEKSRLIAVGCNRHDVTIYAFGLRHNRSDVVAWSQYHQKNFIPTPEADVSHQRRAFSRQMTVLLPQDGNNVPSVAFLDDANGDATKVAAIDVNGNCWIINVWNPHLPPKKIPHFEVDIAGGRMVPAFQGGG